MRTLDVQALLAWSPCYHPKKYLSTDWTGTIFDLFDNGDIPLCDRVWCGLKYLPVRQQQDFAIWCARQALAIPGVKVDKRSVHAVNVAELYLDGNARLEELAIARAAAYAAAAYAAARAAAYAAAYAANAAAYAAYATDAAAARAAAYAAYDAAADAAYDAAADAAKQEMRERQLAQLRTIIKFVEPAN